MVKHISQEGRCRQTRLQQASGFTVTELLVVVLVLFILLCISVPYFFSYRQHYRSEDQALKVMDLMREGSQLALNRRRNIRLEIDLSENAVLLIDENGADPDTLIKKIPLDSSSDVRIDVQPDDVDPPPPVYADAVFGDDELGHFDDDTEVTGHQVWAARFRSDGSVVNAEGTPISATLYSWQPNAPGSTRPKEVTEVRAITMYGGSGSVRYWKHDGEAFVAY